MRVVEKKPFQLAPHTCSVTGRDDAPMIDFEVDISGLDQHLFVRCSTIEDAAKMLGMVPKSEFKAIKERFEALEERFSQVQSIALAIQRVDEAETELDALVAHEAA